MIKQFLRKTILYHRRKVLKANVAVWLYGNASEEMIVIGITGTNGKTTTATLIHHLLQSQGNKTALIGTTGVLIGDEQLSGVQKMTSYDPLALHRLLVLAKQAGCTHAVLEVSSHGLDQERFHHIRFQGGVLTNITQEHMDYHTTMEHYAKAKEKLFRMVQKNKQSNSFAVLPLDDERGKKRSKQLIFHTCITYSHRSNAMLYSGDIQPLEQGTEFVLQYLEQKYTVHTPLVGRFNVANILAACGVMAGLGYTMEQVIPDLQTFTGVRGRQEYLVLDDIHRYIDYAHTPDALEKILQYLQTRREEGQQLYVLFGAPGQREKEKRPIMGHIAETYADIVIITDDDPAKENRRDILADIVRGMEGTMGKEYRVLPGRAHAIDFVADRAQPGDIVLLAGIGHQDVLVTNFGTIPRDEETQIRRALDEKKKRRAETASV